MDPALEAEIAMLSHQKALVDSMNEASVRGDSNIQQFYDNAVVFVTGGSGFLGKLLVEKLFRSCNIKKMYLLMRPRKGTPARERLTEVLNDPVFDAVRRTKPDFATRIVTISGDVTELKLGISDEGWKTVSDEVDVIFHLAATTRFDESLKLATLINVRGTRETMLLGKECKNLRSFVHVSTVYANSMFSRRGQTILDKFYPSPVPPSTMIELAETVDEDRLKSITPEFTKDWTNTYTFTKTVAEETVRFYAGDLPICIVRPSIVVATYREPVPGWLDMSCAYGASGLILGPGLGLMRVLQCDEEKFVSLVPGDIVNNVTIAAGWKTGVKDTQEKKEIEIYTVSSTENPIQLRTLIHQMQSVGEAFPTPKAAWAAFIITTKSKLMFTLLTWFLHDIPAFILDGICLLMGKKIMFRRIYEKINKMSVLLSNFTLNEWFFDMSSLTKLSIGMTDSDKKIYNFDIKQLKWKEYIQIWCVGIRKYIIKDGLKDTEYAKRKQFWLKIANYILLFVYLYCIFKLLSLVFKVFII